MRRALLSVALSGLLVATAAAPAEAKDTNEGRRTITGTIEGAAFRVELPDRWNGTLVLYSHGYLPPGFPDFGIALTNRSWGGAETEGWLLANGYALAASQFSERGVGYHIERGLREQIDLLDWFEDNVGRPRHTISYGQSLGAALAVLLAERNPHRFDGVATICGAYDPQGLWNAVLDMTFAVKTLLAPGQDIDLVRPRDAAASQKALTDAIDAATATPEGRARLALAAAFNNVTGQYTAHEPRPTDLAKWIQQQALWLRNAYTLEGTIGRADLEPRAGGNPSSNVGIDYRRQLARSSQDALVRRAYREAGLDLRADLARLNAAPRISADPAAVDYMYRYGVPRGVTPAPVISVHTTGDGGAVPDQERWYAEQVRRAGDPRDLRQLYIERGAHCSISAAEEITVLRSLFHRVDTGQWPNTSPRRLNAAADALGEGYDLVLDFGTGVDAPVSPAFTRFTPPVFLRPSR